jgi:hypothetical protein
LIIFVLIGLAIALPMISHDYDTTSYLCYLIAGLLFLYLYRFIDLVLKVIQSIDLSGYYNEARVQEEEPIHSHIDDDIETGPASGAAVVAETVPSEGPIASSGATVPLLLSTPQPSARSSTAAVTASPRTPAPIAGPAQTAPEREDAYVEEENFILELANRLVALDSLNQRGGPSLLKVRGILEEFDRRFPKTTCSTECLEQWRLLFANSNNYVNLEAHIRRFMYLFGFEMHRVSRRGQHSSSVRSPQVPPSASVAH